MSTVMPVILTGLVGSHAYGLDHAGSDKDFLSIHVAPMEDILGLRSRAVQDHTIITADPDHTSHELEKFCRLALKGNPTVNELLWLENQQYAVSSIYGQSLIRHREHFLSARTVSAYRGYITGQIHKLTLKDGTSTARFPKASKHVLRLCYQLNDLSISGVITPRLHEGQVAHIEQKVAEAVEADRPDYIEVEARRLLEVVDANLAYPNLPMVIARPEPDVEAINRLVVAIRRWTDLD